MATQKQNNFGIKNTAIKNGKVCIVVNYYDDNGKRKQFCKTTDIPAKDVGRGRKKEVEKLRDEIVEQFYKDKERKQREDKLNYSIVEDITFLELLKKYADSKFLDVEEDVEPITEVTYKNFHNCTNVVREYLVSIGKEEILAKDVSTEFLKKFYNNLKQRKTSRGKFISKNTLRHYMLFINPAFKFGCNKGYIQINPALNFTLPKIDKVHIQYLNTEESKKFMEECSKNLELGFPCIIDLIYGLRRSELLGLTWDKIDFNNETITIDQSLFRLENNFHHYKTLKTMSSIATFPFVKGVKELLLAKKHDIEEKKKLNNYNRQYENFVFVDNEGNLLKPDRISRYVHTVCEKAEITDIHFHGLRHTCATNLLANGATLKEVQEWLRHSTYKTTSDFYIHISHEQRIITGERVAKMLALETEAKSICNKFKSESIEKVDKNIETEFDNTKNTNVVKVFDKINI